MPVDRPKFLDITPQTEEFKTAAQAWNEFASRLDESDKPTLAVKPIDPSDNKPLNFSLRSKVFDDGSIVSSSGLDSDPESDIFQHRQDFPVYTRALIGNTLYRLVHLVNRDTALRIHELYKQGATPKPA